jgi:uncharacterized protein involved in type VI secretion and phage assembly
MIETPEEFAKRYWNSLAPHYSEHRKTLAYFIAEHDAAIRQECAERAIAWRHKKYSCTVPGMDEELAAVIVGKEGE